MKRYDGVVNKMRYQGTRKLRYETNLYPDFPPRVTDYYIITKSLDRMDLIAYDYYNDETMWWVIQRANNLPLGTLSIPPGTQVRIPYPLPIYELIVMMYNSQF